MPIDQIVAPLLRIPIFSGLRPAQIAEIAHRTERMKFRPGDFITTAGQAGDGAYLIVSGAVDAIGGSSSPPAHEPVQPGSLIGEMAMLIEHDYAVTTIARERVHCLKIMRAALHAHMLADPTLAEHFAQHIAQRLAEVTENLRSIDGALVATSPSEPGHEQPRTSISRGGLPFETLVSR
ncbi:MAG: cyclic nucleotide-binding domain-containing protein [Hyphomicrobiaceae bacterium]|nr:MAG: cyclic nucleotide-binding domain-containing protein [Hyphomicrobiaceae bacterium]